MDLKNMNKNKVLSREYLMFFAAIFSLTIFVAGAFSYLSFKSILKENSALAKVDAKNIEAIISETFDYTNQINTYIGEQIAKTGRNSPKKILEIFRDAEVIRHRNSDLFSWSAFDWIDEKNYQVVNGRIGIRKTPPNMSSRHYSALCPQNPWTLQISPPTSGNPSNDWVIPAGTGVADKNKKYLGAVVIGFNISELTSKITQRVNQKTSFVILDKDLRLILQSHDITLPKNSDFFQKNFNKKIFSEKEKPLDKGIVIDDVRFFYYKNFSKYPYIVITGVNKSIVYNQLIISTLPRILEFIVLAAFFLLVLYIFKAKMLVLLEAEKLLSRSLEAAHKAKDRLLFSISHDIRNYIYGIAGLGRFILDSKNDSKTLQEDDLEAIEQICTQAEELRYFVEDLLDSSQISHGGFNLGNLVEADFGKLVKTVLSLNKRLIADNSVIIKSNIEPEMPALKCDPRRIKQILNNLISNAIKYSKPQGEILIKAQYLSKANQIYLEILDNGFGMTKSEINNYLSGEGQKIDKSEILKSKKVESYGIGMSIALRLIKLHHGKIEVESEKKVGTKVKLYFPLS